MQKYAHFCQGFCAAQLLWTNKAFFFFPRSPWSLYPGEVTNDILARGLSQAHCEMPKPGMLDLALICTDCNTPRLLVGFPHEKAPN